MDTRTSKMNIGDIIQNLLGKWRGQEQVQATMPQEESGPILGPERPWFEGTGAPVTKDTGQPVGFGKGEYSWQAMLDPESVYREPKSGDLYEKNPNANILGITDYASGYKNSSGYPSRMTPEYINNIWSEIQSQYPKASQDQMENLLANIVAMSLTETGMGSAKANADPNSPYYRQSNFWGWFKGGDRGYDPSQEEMSKEIVRGLGSGYNLINQDMNKDMAVTYSGNDRADRWLRDYQSALKELGYLN